jgi:hypothetical protein
VRAMAARAMGSLMQVRPCVYVCELMCLYVCVCLFALCV